MDGIEIKFKCGHCEQEYSQDTFNFAVALYGIFFLMGKESGYAGITCPSCLKTIIHEGEKNQIESLRETLSTYVSFGDIRSQLNLRYHSSVNYFPQNTKQYKDINYHYWNFELSSEDLNFDYLQHKLHLYIEEENLDENYFCTYAFDDEAPMGSNLSIGWFKKDWVEEFIQIETENSVRIFPRYVPYSSLYDDIEDFCWNNQIQLDQFEQSKSKCEADQNNLNYQEILDANPNMRMPNDIDRMKDLYIKLLKEIEFRTPFDFLSILVSDLSAFAFPILSHNELPTSFGFEVLRPNEVPSTFFWKTLHPFLNREIPKSSHQF